MYNIFLPNLPKWKDKSKCEKVLAVSRDIFIVASIFLICFENDANTHYVTRISDICLGIAVLVLSFEHKKYEKITAILYLILGAALIIHAIVRYGF